MEPIDRTFLVLIAVVPLSSGLIALGATVPLMFAVAPLAGALMTPFQAAASQLVGRVAHPGTMTEAFTWLTMAGVAGCAVGDAIAGFVVDAAGWQAAALVLCGCAFGGSVVAYLRRATLRPVEQGPAAAPVSPPALGWDGAARERAERSTRPR